MRSVLVPFSLVAIVAYGQGASRNLAALTDLAMPSSVATSVPDGPSSVVGGSIAKVDIVSDSLVLQITGGKPITIRFDERTQLYEDAKRLSILSVHPANHASIETRLDGSAIFATRIHIISSSLDGELYGQVVSFGPPHLELKLRVADRRDLITLRVTAATTVARLPQEKSRPLAASLSDLAQESLINVVFKTDESGRGYATHIEIRAVPGSIGIIQGNLTSLDLRAGRMTIESKGDIVPQDVSFDPSHFLQSKRLRVGSAVRVKTQFDGSRFVAVEIFLD